MVKVGHAGIANSYWVYTDISNGRTTLSFLSGANKIVNIYIGC